MDQQNRLAYIDALRGIAIIGVIVTHAATLTGVQGLARTFTNAAGNGVLLFFVVSACTIFLTLSKARQRETHVFANFYTKRFWRLIPVYWLGIVAYTIVYGLGSRGWRDGPELWHYPLHITLTNLLWPTTPSSVVPGGWSISCEALFYLTVPLWFAVLRGWKSAVALLGAFIVGGYLAVRALRPELAPLFDGVSERVMGDFWYRSLLNQIGVFGFGILLFYLTTQGPAQIAWLKRRSVNLIGLAASAVTLIAAAFWPVHLGRPYVYGAGFMALGLCLSQIPWSAIVNKVTCWIGQVSYSAYLAHFLILKQVNDILPMALASGFERFAVLMAISLPATLLTAYLGYRYVEQPTTEIAKGIVRRREHGKAPVATTGAELQTAP